MTALHTNRVVSVDKPRGTVVDLFSGFGGFSLGAEAAGYEVLWAGNHWQFAVDAHKKHFPNSMVVCQDLNQANFYDLPDFDILLASPACQGHSSASRPKRRIYHDAYRSTAWAVISCADAKSPEHVVIENVLDFRAWRLYDAWCATWKDMGYSLRRYEVTASFHGVPQRRTRLFIVASRGAKSPKLELEQDETERPFGPCIDWDKGDWELISTKSASVQSRVARGRSNFGDRFVTQHVTNHPGVGLHEPIRTVTAQDQWAVVDGDRMRPLTIPENRRAMGFPSWYEPPDGATRTDIVAGFGNAVCPPVVTKLLVELGAA